MTPKVKKAAGQPDPLCYEQKYSTRRSTGTFLTTLIVRDYSDYKSCKILEVDFYLQSEHQKKPTPVGYMIAWLIDKTVQEEDKKQTWIQELLIGETAVPEEDEEDDQTHELRNACREVFTRNGQPRQRALKHRKKCINLDHLVGMERLVCIDTFLLYKAWRGRGLSTMAMKGFHKLVKEDLKVGNEHAGVTTVFLSPARSDCADDFANTYSDVEVEEKLIKVYQRSNYTVWLRGDPSVEGTATVMGIDLCRENEDEENKVRRMRKRRRIE